MLPWFLDSSSSLTLQFLVLCVDDRNEGCGLLFLEEIRKPCIARCGALDALGWPLVDMVRSSVTLARNCCDRSHGSHDLFVSSFVSLKNHGAFRVQGPNQDRRVVVPLIFYS